MSSRKDKVLNASKDELVSWAADSVCSKRFCSTVTDKLCGTSCKDCRGFYHIEDNFQSMSVKQLQDHIFKACIEHCGFDTDSRCCNPNFTCEQCWEC